MRPGAAGRADGLQSRLIDRTRVADLGPLAGLTALQELYLDGTRVADLAPLAGLAGLQRLSLSGTRVADLAPLAGLTGLQELYSGTRVADLAPLAGLTNCKRSAQDAGRRPGAAGRADGLQTLDLGRTLGGGSVTYRCCRRGWSGKAVIGCSGGEPPRRTR